jgi:hypothetical protein
MAYINNGNYRAKTLTVNKTINSVSISGYPKTYNITDAFSTYDALTDEEFQRLSNEDYNTRLAAFYAYVNSEDGCEANTYAYAEGEEPFGEDATLCPIG